MIFIFRRSWRHCSRIQKTKRVFLGIWEGLISPIDFLVYAVVGLDESFKFLLYLQIDLLQLFHLLHQYLFSLFQMILLPIDQFALILELFQIESQKCFFLCSAFFSDFELSQAILLVTIWFQLISPFYMFFVFSCITRVVAFLQFLDFSLHSIKLSHDSILVDGCCSYLALNDRHSFIFVLDLLFLELHFRFQIFMVTLDSEHFIYILCIFAIFDLNASTSCCMMFFQKSLMSIMLDCFLPFKGFDVAKKLLVFDLDTFTAELCLMQRFFDQDLRSFIFIRPHGQTASIYVRIFQFLVVLRQFQLQLVNFTILHLNHMLSFSSSFYFLIFHIRYLFQNRCNFCSHLNCRLFFWHSCLHLTDLFLQALDNHILSNWSLEILNLRLEIFKVSTSSTCAITVLSNIEIHPSPRSLRRCSPMWSRWTLKGYLVRLVVKESLGPVECLVTISCFWIALELEWFVVWCIKTCFWLRAPNTLLQRLQLRLSLLIIVGLWNQTAWPCIFEVAESVVHGVHALFLRQKIILLSLCSPSWCASDHGRRWDSGTVLLDEHVWRHFIQS